MKILFQGDSITDAGRDRRFPFNYGVGYVSEIAYRFEKAGLKHEILNTGVGGNRICDMYSRWIEDTLNIDFDVLSILCGINDIGFQIRQNKGANAEKFEFVYDRMIYEVMEKNDKTKLVIMEPFVFNRDLENINLQDRNDIFLNYDYWRSQIEERAAISKELAKKYNATFVPLISVFDKYIAEHGVEELTNDNIHPTFKGHRIIAEQWLKVCGNIVEYNIK